ncbi:MAG: hypothetical protein K2H34_10955, partial [Lachnospiraceae bacterium]|nr:hypothetical protein [Lachnospiraceae bacterium]
MRTLTKLLLVAMLLLLPCVQAEASAKTWVNVNASPAFKITKLDNFTTAEGMCVDPKDNAIYTIQKK